MKNEIQYVSFPLLPGVVKCGKCFRGRIRRYKSRCKVCGAMNIAFYCLPAETQLLAAEASRRKALPAEEWIPRVANAVARLID
jgi:hypothetical protein